MPFFYRCQYFFCPNERTIFFLPVSGDICNRVAEFIPYTNSRFFLVALQERNLDLLLRISRSRSPNRLRVVLLLESLERNPA